MTNNEADLIIDKIYAGGKFSTRYQEESWGLYFVNGVLHYWSERLLEDGSSDNIAEEWEREKLHVLLTKTYSFEIINERIRFDKLIVDGREFESNITHFAFPEPMPIIRDMQELSKLPFFPNLTSASFTESNLNGSGLAWVCDCNLLENLNLQGTKITDRDLQSLYKLGNLKYLRLKDNPQLTDNSISYLLSLTMLIDLQIQETSITEKGLRLMRNMPNLNQIILSEDPVRFTKSGLIEISKNLPDTTILVKGVGEYLKGKYISFQ
jgi:hypothetical protein